MKNWKNKIVNIFFSNCLLHNCHAYIECWFMNYFFIIVLQTVFIQKLFYRVFLGIYYTQFYIYTYLFGQQKKNGKTVLLFEYWIISCVYKNRFLCGKRRPRHFYLLNWVSMRDWKRKCWAIGYLIEFQSEHFLKNPRPPVHHWPLFSNNPKSW